jgi:retinol dehydrogenase 12
LHNLFKRFLAAPEKGARPPVWLATAQELEGVNGRYFELKVEKPYATNAMDDSLMEKLYDFSMKKAGL